MADHFSTRNNNPSSAALPPPPPASSRPPPTLPGPLLHPYPFPHPNNSQPGTSQANVGSSPPLPSIPPFSSLPTTSTTSPALPLPSTSQLAHDHLGRLGDPSINSASTDNSSKANETRDRPPFQHPIPPHIQHFDRYSTSHSHHPSVHPSNSLSHQPLPPPPTHTFNPPHHHREHRTPTPTPPPIATLRPLQPPSRIELSHSHRGKSVLPSFHDPSVKPDLPPPLQEPFVPHLKPLNIPPIRTLPSPQSQAPPQAPPSTQRHPALHPRPPQPVPTPLPPRPSLVVGPRADVLPKTPEFQRAPLPGSSRTPPPSNPTLGRPTPSPDYPQHYRTSRNADVMPSRYDPTRSGPTQPSPQQPGPHMVFSREEHTALPSPDRDRPQSRSEPQTPQTQRSPQPSQTLPHQQQASALHPQLSTATQNHSQRHVPQLLQPEPQRHVPSIDDPNRAHPDTSSSHAPPRATTPQQEMKKNPVFKHSEPQAPANERLFEHTPLENEQQTRKLRDDGVTLHRDGPQTQDRQHQLKLHSTKSRLSQSLQAPQGQSQTQSQVSQEHQSQSRSQPISNRIDNTQRSPQRSEKRMESSLIDSQKEGGLKSVPLENKYVRSLPLSQNAIHPDRFGKQQISSMSSVIPGHQLPLQKGRIITASNPSERSSLQPNSGEDIVVRADSVDSGTPLAQRTSLLPTLSLPSKLKAGVNTCEHNAEPEPMEIEKTVQADPTSNVNNRGLATNFLGRNEIESITHSQNPQKSAMPQKSAIESPGFKEDNIHDKNREWERHGHRENAADVEMHMAATSSTLGNINNNDRNCWKVSRNGTGNANGPLDTGSADQPNAWTPNSGNVSFARSQSQSSPRLQPAQVTHSLPSTARTTEQHHQMKQSVLPNQPLAPTLSAHSQSDNATPSQVVPVASGSISTQRQKGSSTMPQYISGAGDNLNKIGLKSQKSSPPIKSNLTNSSKPAPSLGVSNISATSQPMDQIKQETSEVPHSRSDPVAKTQTHSNQQNHQHQQKHLKVEDALAYLEKVKRQFSDKQNVYNRFLDVMKEFKAQDIDTTEVIKRVSELFYGHKDLILGFNTFLPPGYKIQVTENRAGFVGPQGNFSELRSYRNSTPKPPPPRPLPSKPGLPSPKQSKELGRPGVSSPSSGSVAPSSSKPGSGTDTPIKEPMPTVSNGSALSRPIAPSKPLPAPHSTPSKTHAREEAERQHRQGQAPSSVQKPGEGHQAKSVEFERAITFMTQIKERFSDDPETFAQFLRAMKHFRDEQKSIREVFDTVAHLFGPHKDLLVKFKEFIPFTQKHAHPRHGDGRSTSPTYPPGPRSPSNAISKIRKGRDLKFFEKMKTQLGNNKSHLYIEFIKCLSLLSQGIVSQEELLVLTSEILRDCPEAQNAFLSYLESFGNNDGTASGVDDSSSSSSEKDETPVNEERLRYYKTKPMSEIAAECGHDAIVSYRRMPRDFPKLRYSGRTAQERRILNDTWVNITTGSEDFAFVRKNGCEDNLFRAEDDRYELDMVISTNRATIQKLEVVVSTMSKLSPSEKKRHALATGVLSAIHFNSIRRIYGLHGDEIVAQVRMNPSVAVPIVIPRLKQKDAEWRKIRNEMNKLWREVGERNFHRSLDHRFGFFKMIDKKDLNMKSLLLDIMDPVSSIAARDAEMTRARNYAIPKGAGSAFDRSGATKAVTEAAEIAQDVAPRSLRLKFENLWIHKVAFSLIESAAADEASADVRRFVAEFGKVIEAFFDVNLSNGLRKTTRNSDEKQQVLDEVESQGTKECKVFDDVEVLFGDESIYVLFRFYHILYERLFTAFEMAHEQVWDRERREKLNELAGDHVPTESIVKPRMMKFTSEKDVDGGFTLGPETGDGMHVFSRFLDLARPFVRSKLDYARYEEKCRVLLGTGAYCVFTLDKVMQRLTKQIHAVFGSDRVARELIVLFEKGCDAVRRSVKLKGTANRAGVEELYSIAASRLLAEMRQPGTHLMRFGREYCELEGETVEVGDVRLRGGVLTNAEKRKQRNVDRRHIVNGQEDILGCMLTIEVLGETGDDEHFKALDERQDCIDAYLEFCASYDDCNIHGRNAREGGVEASGSGGGVTGGVGMNAYVHGNHMRGMNGLSKNPKGSSSGANSTGPAHAHPAFDNCRRFDVEIERQRPNDRKELIRRAGAAIVENGLRCRMDRDGTIRYTAGTTDWTFIPGRKRRWSEVQNDVKKENDRNRSTKRFRQILRAYHKKNSSSSVIVAHSLGNSGTSGCNGGGKRRDRDGVTSSSKNKSRSKSSTTKSSKTDPRGSTAEKNTNEMKD